MESQEDKIAPLGGTKQKTFIEKLKNEQWTRVIDPDDFNFATYSVYSLKDDLIEFQTNPIKSVKKAWENWEMIYNPKDADW
jgi:hypothetical protein